MIFLPPSSPHLDPIEMAFSKLKTLVRNAAARTYQALRQQVGAVCDLFQPKECRNCFIAAGYGANRRRHALGPVEIQRELMRGATAWIMALNEVSVLSARLAIRLNSLSFMKKFSIRWRHW